MHYDRRRGPRGGYEYDEDSDPNNNDEDDEDIYHHHRGDGIPDGARYMSQQRDVEDPEYENEETVDDERDYSAEPTSQVRVVSSEQLKMIEKWCIEVGERAVWSVSSAKPNFGVLPLRDWNSSTYWQSDGELPHTISIQFPELTVVDCVAIMLNKNDDSYAPSEISITVGTHPTDSLVIWKERIDTPDGWIFVPLLLEEADVDDVVTLKEVRGEPESSPLDTFSRGAHSNPTGGLKGAPFTGTSAFGRNGGNVPGPGIGRSNATRLPSAAKSDAPNIASVESIITVPWGSTTTPQSNEAAGNPSRFAGGVWRGGGGANNPVEFSDVSTRQRVWCTYVHISIHANHNNGRDTHVRGIRLLSVQQQPLYVTPPFSANIDLR